MTNDVLEWDNDCFPEFLFETIILECLVLIVWLYLVFPIDLFYISTLGTFSTACVWLKFLAITLASISCEFSFSYINNWALLELEDLNSEAAFYSLSSNVTVSRFSLKATFYRVCKFWPAVLFRDFLIYLVSLSCVFF